MAVSVTIASTYSRVALLKMQLSAALRRTTNISKNKLQVMMLGVEKKLIRSFSIYAFDSNELCRAELILEVDWNEYDLQMSIGNVTVAIDEDKWADQTSIEVDEAISAFQDFVKQEKLRTEWRSSMTREVYADDAKYQVALKELGLVKGKSVKWAGTKQGAELRVDELPELRVGLYLSD